MSMDRGVNRLGACGAVLQQVPVLGAVVPQYKLIGKDVFICCGSFKDARISLKPWQSELPDMAAANPMPQGHHYLL